MDRDTLLAGLDFSRTRLVELLDKIDKSGHAVALVWRPGPGRAHIAWQAMHCAATHDKYLNAFKGGKPTDENLVARFGGGSTPSDQNVPDLATIRSALEKNYKNFRDYIATLTPADLARKLASGRTIAESILLMAWHEAHHQGQIHLTWNLYKQAHGVA